MITDTLRQQVSTTPACTRVDPDLFYSDHPADIALAKTICGPCPLRSGCLQQAIERGESWGIWGGRDPHERGAHQRRHNGVRANSATARRARVAELSVRMTPAEIAETLGVSADVVCADRRRAGIAVSRSDWASRRADVYRLHNEGQPIAVIMLNTGLGRRTVSRYLAERRRRARFAA